MSPRTPHDPSLFDDLPLHTEEPPRRVPPTRAQPEPSPPKPAEEQTADVQPAAKSLLLFDDDLEDEKTVPPSPPEATKEPEGEPTEDIADVRRSRLLAGLIDLGVVLAVAVSVAACAAWMGVDLTPLPWAPMALFLLAFSFLYSVFPLAFWGRTPGMAWLGLQARSLDGKSLSFDQTAWRWLAGVATVMTFGLPLALSLKGTFLSDLVSKSKVEVSGR